LDNEKICDPELELVKKEGVLKVGKRKFARIIFS